jgi:hypothetical protein
MNPPKDTELMQDDEYQLTFLLDRPLPPRPQTWPEVAEHVLHLPPSDER